MTVNAALLITLFYFAGFIFEFNLTMNQINSSEEHRNYIYNELKLNKRELFSAVLIVSLAWIFVEIYVHLSSSKNENTKYENEKVWIRR